MKRLLMGNEAMGLAAIDSGAKVACGYPGTPSTEILETVAKHGGGDIHVEWSVNEKAAVEVAAGAAYAGMRALVTMKQVGLNVASDPVMSLAYIGVKGGMVIIVADDPGPISSQTEQDTRHFAQFSKLPVFDPSSPEEAYEMVRDAFELSEEYSTPVIVRPTTRVCHACALVETREPSPPPRVALGFEKDPKWVIFPQLSYGNHLKIEARNMELAARLSSYRFNAVSGGGKKGVAAGGISCAYLMEALGGTDVRLLKVSTPHPFPEKLALEFLDGLEEVMVFEELDPVIERELLRICGKHRLGVTVRGKLTGDTQAAGENSVESIRKVLHTFLGLPLKAERDFPGMPKLPARPPVLCAGCPHRASFYAAKQAMKGKKAVFTGDIGCYTLGNAKPLEAVDTCLCMGAGITIAQGLSRAEPGVKHLAFIGDSTFFASGITGVLNAVYNGSDITVIVLDNDTTAMTGHQPHPGTGRTITGGASPKASIPEVLKALGVGEVIVADPLDLEAAVEAVRKASDFAGVSAVVFKSPCVALADAPPPLAVDQKKCTGCGKCSRELGCPAIAMSGGRAQIEPAMCRGCGLCAQVCPAGAIEGGIEVLS